MTSNNDFQYIVAVYPPFETGAPFDVEEPDFAGACKIAKRYRERGWSAVVIGTADPVQVDSWAVGGVGCEARVVEARNADEALAIARTYYDPAYTSVQLFE